MRLTLRTLLAWLDDTLPPTDVADIGRQVAESSVAQDLKEKIARVTRQRRLTVPPSSGPEAVDPNLVAAYIDNELTPEQVTEYEKRCLSSDVHLAEVASVHQILSGIGQKAQVPDEARTRMYQLVKGREAVGAGVPRPGAPTKPPRPTEPAEPWTPQELTGPSWLERFGPAAAVVGLIVLLGWLVWANLAETGTPTLASAPAGVATPPEAGRGPQPPAQPPAATSTPDQSATQKKEAVPPAPPPADTPKEGEMTQETAPPPQEKEEPAQTPELPPGAVALTGEAPGVLLRYNPGTRDWERLGPSAPLKDGDSLVCLAPFRAPLQFDAAQVLLIGEAVVRLHAVDAERAAHLDLNRGRLIVQDAERPVAVGIADRVLQVTPPPGGVVGLHRIEQRRAGERAQPAILQVIVPEGQAVVASTAGTQTLTGPSLLEFNPATVRFSEPPSQAVPAWVTDPSPAPQEAQPGKPFADHFRPGQSPISSLVEASEDPNVEVSQLAIAALGALGNLDLVVPLLSAEGRPALRRAAIAVLRSALAQGPEALTDVRNLLEQTWDPETAGTVEKLLLGYTSQEAQDNATSAALVGQLSSKDPGLRELALDNLQALTGRDRMGYDPDKPEEGSGLQAWQDWLKDKDDSPAAAPKEKTP